MITDLFINGEFKDCKEKQNIINPSTGKVMAQVSLASLKDVDLAIAGARTAFDKGDWPRLPLEGRKGLLLRISQGILNKAGELANLETLNTGKPIKESTFMDIPSAAKTFEYSANNFQKYLMPESPEIQGEAQCKLIREAVGVVA